MGENVTAESITTRDCNGLGRQLPPNGGSNDIDPSTPCQAAGSFSLLEPAGSYPIDLETGLPYRLMFFGLKRPLDLEAKCNAHHPVHPRKATDSEGETPYEFGEEYMSNIALLPHARVAGMALRVSRVYRAHPELHRMTHEQCKQGPVLPRSMPAKFAWTVKHLAGVVSRYAYDPTADEGERIRPQSKADFERQTTVSWVHPETYSYGRPEGYQQRVIGLAFARYVATQDIHGVVSSRKIDQFLSSTNDRRSEAGLTLLKTAVAMSVAPLEASYAHYRREGLIVGDLLQRSPSLFSLVMQHTKPAFQEVLNALERRLAA